MPGPLAHLRSLVRISMFAMAPGRDPHPRSAAADAEIIELVTGGVGWVEESPGRWTEVAAGSICWHAAGERTIARSRFTDPYRCLAVDVQVRPGSRRRVPRITRWDDLGEVRSFAERAARLTASDAIGRDTVLAWAYSRLLLQAQLHGVRAAAPAVPEGVRRVADLIDGRYAEDLAVGDLAAAAGWSPSHLHAQFRAHLGVSPHQHLMRRRLRAACDRLAASDDPLADVAASAGFHDAHALCRAFRAAHGTSPQRWRTVRRGTAEG